MKESWCVLEEKRLALSFNSFICFKNRRRDETFVKEVVHQLELDELLDKFPYELSGGEQQRVSIARALIRKPTIILADEPTGNLDRENRQHVMKLLRQCQQRFNQTVLMVTHDVELSKGADSIIYMEDGKIIRHE